MKHLFATITCLVLCLWMQAQTVDYSFGTVGMARNDYVGHLGWNFRMYSDLASFEIQPTTSIESHRLQVKMGFNLFRNHLPFDLTVYPFFFAGEGAILVEQKQAIENAIQGDWKLFRRVDEEVVQRDVPVSIDGADITMGNRSGTILVNDDLTFTVSGIFAANITFRVLNNGFLRADVGKQTIVLRK